MKRFKIGGIICVIISCFITVFCVLGYFVDVKGSGGFSLQEAFDLISEQQKTGDFVAPTFMYHDDLIVGFSTIPLTLHQGQSYFLVTTLTWIGKTDATIQFDVDVISYRLIESGKLSSSVPFGVKDTISLLTNKEKYQYKESKVHVPYGELPLGRYLLRFGLAGKVFATHDIVIVE